MKKNSSGVKDALKSAQAGTPIPQKDFSTAKSESKAAGSGKPEKGSLKVAASLPTESATSTPVSSEKRFEGSPEDWSKDYAAAKRKGIKMSDYENSAEDRISDKAGQRRLEAEDGNKTINHPVGYKPGVSAFSNSPKTAHGFGHPASARQGHLRCSGHSGAHQIGKKK